MEKISNSVVKKDHAEKMNGSALYVDDLCMPGVLHAKLLHSSKARAVIKNITFPFLPPQYSVVTYKDVPGTNHVHIVQDDIPVFAEKNVEYIGDTILLLAGPSLSMVEELLSQIEVEYEELAPVLSAEDSDIVFFDYHYAKGDADKAFAEADETYTETFETGYQEQAYLEPNGLIAYTHDGRVTVRGSLQCPYYVHGAIAAALGYSPERVQVIQDTTGGGFGGKEDYPSILACQLAVAAIHTGQPVKLIFDRREDMAFTSKRHPSRSRYTAAIKDGKITALDIDVLFNSGAYTTLSPVVLQRGIIGAPGVYNIPHLTVHGQAKKTNTVPNGAYRGFGAPQTFFAVETLLSHIAQKRGEEPLSFKTRHLVVQGNTTSTGGKYHFHVPLPEMIERADALSHYRQKRKAYKVQTGRYRKGIGISLIYHGCGFTGNSERDFIKAVARLRKSADGHITILASNADIGQGIKTTFAKIVAHTLNLPLEQITVEVPDTDKVPDSGPTVASRSLMTVGQLLALAAQRLKNDWQEGKEQLIEEHYKHPEYMMPFDINTFSGDAYPTYSWAVSVVEVEIDTLTAATNILGAWGIFDVGVPIDYNIIHGQMQGGFLQGLGYSSMEHMECDARGAIRQNSFTDYIVPTAADVPLLVTDLVINPFSHGPYGAKGAGEMPLVGVAPAYLQAVENALGGPLLYKVPFTPEDTLNALEEVQNNAHGH